MIVKGQKMKLKIAIFLFLFVSLNAMSESKVPDFYTVEWKEQITKFQLPMPFNEVQIKINKSGENLKGIILSVGQTKVQFKDSLLEGIYDISEPEFSYSRTDFDKDNKIESFSIYFEYGRPKLVNLGDVPGCKSPCKESVRDVVVFTVDADYKVSRELRNYGLD